MPQTPHIERHFTASDTVRDIVIGMSDGLTVPFALAAAYLAQSGLPVLLSWQVWRKSQPVPSLWV